MTPLSYLLDDVIYGREPRVIADRMESLPDLAPVFAFHCIICGSAHALLGAVNAITNVAAGFWPAKLLRGGRLAVYPVHACGFLSLC